MLRNNNAARGIKWFSEEKTHGFATLDNHDEIFLHSSQWLGTCRHARAMLSRLRGTAAAMAGFLLAMRCW
jgi:'Cold-shock' DNA-binding domain